MPNKRSELRPLPQQIAQQSTLLSSWVILIYRLLEYRGLDARELFIQSGIGPGFLKNPEARVPHHLVSQHIWRPAAKQIGDETFVLDAAKVIFPGMFHSLSIAMGNASSLLKALQYFVEYRRIIHPLSRMQLSKTDEGYGFSWGPRTPYVTSWASEAVTASLIGQCRELTSDSFSPSYVTIARDLSTRERLAYEAFYQAPVAYGQPQNLMVFDHEVLEKPLLTANPKIERMCVQMTKESIRSLQEEEVVDAVYCRIVEALPTQNHFEEAIAQGLNISLRTMQRRLHKAGTSYDSLLQDTRKELALIYMQDQSLAIQEISYLLGFSKPGNFSRAFKRWTGVSPKNHRE